MRGNTCRYRAGLDASVIAFRDGDVASLVIEDLGMFARAAGGEGGARAGGVRWKRLGWELSRSVERLGKSFAVTAFMWKVCD